LGKGVTVAASPFESGRVTITNDKGARMTGDEFSNAAIRALKSGRPQDATGYALLAVMEELRRMNFLLEHIAASLPKQ
jgi:hypothetical protein